MGRFLLPAALALALGACATNASEEAAASWGKPGVAMVQYWTDASECALAGAQAGADAQAAADVAHASAADTTRVNTAAGAAGGNYSSRYGGVERSVNVNDVMARQRYNEARAERLVREAQEAEVAKCLAARGYRQFRLTDEQSAHLATLAEGSRERREYLHQLGADAAVLAAQGI